MPALIAGHQHALPLSHVALYAAPYEAPRGTKQPKQPQAQRPASHLMLLHTPATSFTLPPSETAAHAAAAAGGALAALAAADGAQLMPIFMLNPLRPAITILDSYEESDQVNQTLDSASCTDATGQLAGGGPGRGTTQPAGKQIIRDIYHPTRERLLLCARLRGDG